MFRISSSVELSCRVSHGRTVTNPPNVMAVKQSVSHCPSARLPVYCTQRVREISRISSTLIITPLTIEANTSCSCGSNFCTSPVFKAPVGWGRGVIPP